MSETLKKGAKVFLRLSKNIIYLKNFENIFSLGCTIKNVQNTKMQLKKICHSQIDRIRAQVVKNFMGNNLEKKNSLGIHNQSIYGIFETP